MQGTDLIIVKEIILLLWKVSECSEEFYEKLGNFSIFAQSKSDRCFKKISITKSSGKQHPKRRPRSLLKETWSQRGG